jgi:hypothetical protein
VPLLSQSKHPDISGEKLDALVNRIQFGGDEVVKAKDGAGSATLSMAMAGARFADSLLKAAQGEKGIVEPTFVESPLYKDKGIDFFASKVELGPSGVEKIHEVGKVTLYEQKLLNACFVDLQKNIAKGNCVPSPFLSKPPLTQSVLPQVSSSSKPTHKLSSKSHTEIPRRLVLSHSACNSTSLRFPDFAVKPVGSRAGDSQVVDSSCGGSEGIASCRFHQLL